MRNMNLNSENTAKSVTSAEREEKMRRRWIELEMERTAKVHPSVIRQLETATAA